LTKITKPTIIVTSLGRTGTKFFQVLFRELIANCTALHEPDYFNFGQYNGINEKFEQAFRQFRESGIINLTIRKIFGSWSLLRISDARFKGEMSHDQAVRDVLHQRRDFISSRPGSTYIESSSAYRGLIDIVDHVFEEHRLVYIIRDGRDWVRSKMNFGITYGHGKIRALVQPYWPTPLDLEGDPWRNHWRDMSRFEKLCWAWDRLNKYALSTVSNNENARVFRFEDIFKSDKRDKNVYELVNYAIEIVDREMVSMSVIENRMERKIHSSQGPFPAWKEWPDDNKAQFEEICGELMSSMGYILH